MSFLFRRHKSARTESPTKRVPEQQVPCIPPATDLAPEREHLTPSPTKALKYHNRMASLPDQGDLDYLARKLKIYERDDRHAMTTEKVCPSAKALGIDTSLPILLSDELQKRCEEFLVMQYLADEVGEEREDWYAEAEVCQATAVLLFDVGKAVLVQLPRTVDRPTKKTSLSRAARNEKRLSSYKHARGGKD